MECAHGQPQQNVAIVLDASCDIPPVERHPGVWEVLPDTFKGRDISVIDQGEHSRELTRIALTPGTGITAHAPTVEEFEGAFSAFAGVERVYSLHAAEEFSQAVVHARIAAATRGNVHIVELNTPGIGVGLVALRLQQLAAEGHQVDALDAFLARYAREVRFLIVPDRFDQKARRRMSAAVMLSGKHMMSSGRRGFAAQGRLRTRRATIAAIERYVRQYAPQESIIRMAVGHGDAAGAVDPLLDIVERLRPQARVQLVGRIGPRLVSRVGTRCIGLAWIAE